MSNIPNGRAEMIRVYGNPTKNGKLDPVWREQNIVMMDLPYSMRLAWDKDTIVRRIAVHRLVVDDLTAILTDIWNHCRKRAKANAENKKAAAKIVDAGALTAFWDKLTMQWVQHFGLDLYGGAFNYRLIRGGKSLSTHSWGIAIDLDPERNGMGDSTFSMPDFAVEAFERRGWVWGGRWKGRGVDAMHFQRAG